MKCFAGCKKLDCSENRILKVSYITIFVRNLGKGLIIRVEVKSRKCFWLKSKMLFLFCIFFQKN